MPWTGKEFQQKHWKGASPEQASKAAEIASAMVRDGHPENVAIPTAIVSARRFIAKNKLASGNGAKASK